MRLVLMIFTALMLAGCGVRGQGERFLSDADIEAKDDKICTDLGAVKGTQPYIDCRLRLRSDRSSEDRSRRMRGVIGAALQ